MATNGIKTSIIIFSDTHGMDLAGRIPDVTADVCIHAGDMTDESKLHEFHATLKLLKAIKAPLKLVITGNHDFTLDTPAFQRKLAEVKPPLDPALVRKFYGDFDEAKKLFTDAEKDGIHLLSEGTHVFTLQNGARLKVYASPNTPSLGDYAFQFPPSNGHDFAIQPGTDVVVTHGPPRGVLDRTCAGERAGCPDLFAAVAKVRPQVHCFGHIHHAWGAKVVAWRESLSEKPSHLVDIDNYKSRLVEQRSTLHRTRFDTDEEVERKREKLVAYDEKRYCAAGLEEDERGKKTLSVNAAIKGGDGGEEKQLPWLVDVMLSRAEDDDEKEEIDVGDGEKDGEKETPRGTVPSVLKHQVRGDDDTS